MTTRSKQKSQNVKLWPTTTIRGVEEGEKFFASLTGRVCLAFGLCSVLAQTSGGVITQRENQPTSFKRALRQVSVGTS